MNDILVNSFEFCRRNGKLDGKIAIADLSRLRNICASDSGELTWHLEGSTSKLGHLQLNMEVSGKLELVCQRCMEPFSFELNSQAVILLAENEDMADEIEEMLADDDPTEVIVGEEKQDMLVLVEDEVLLSLPLSPTHDNCPGVPEKKDSDDSKSPFAVLRELKK